MVLLIILGSSIRLPHMPEGPSNLFVAVSLDVTGMEYPDQAMFLPVVLVVDVACY